MKKSKISLVVLMMLVVVTVANSVLAMSALIEYDRTGSITITALGRYNYDTEQEPKGLKGVKYSLYKVSPDYEETVTTVAEAEEYIMTETPVRELTTGDNGVVSFTNLELGRYYAKVTRVPAGTSDVPESFLVDVPMTDESGTEWVYNVNVEPKVSLGKGNVELTKTDIAGNPIEGVVFKVQVSCDDMGGTLWPDLEPVDDYEWKDYIPEGENDVVTLTTDSEGKIEFKNFPITYNQGIAYYRFVEISSPDEAYIIDNANLDYVHCFAADGKTTVVHSDGTEEAPAEIAQMTVINNKPQITKKVGGNKDVQSVGITDTIEYTITVDVPTVIEDMSTFKVEDTLPEGIILYSGSVEVMGTIPEGTELITAYAADENDNGFVINFDTQELSKYSALIITYEAKLDADNAVLGDEGNINTAKLTYTNKIDIDGSSLDSDVKTVEDDAKVVTGGIKIHKVNENGEGIEGTVFKIATSEEEAEGLSFMKNELYEDIELITQDDGYVIMNGLAYNDDGTEKSYWLVETQASTYEEDGEIKYYSLLKRPVEVLVGNGSQPVEIEIVNRKPLKLPLTGGIGIALFVIAGIGIMTYAVVASKKQNVNE